MKKYLLSIVSVLVLSVPFSAFAAISLKQHNLSSVTNGSFINTVSFANPPSVGHLIIVALSYFGGGSDYFKSLTDNQGNTYTQVSTTQHAGASSDCERLYWAYASTSAGTFTITGDFSSGTPGSGDTMVAIFDYAGNALYPFDKGQGTTGNSITVSPSGITPKNDNSLIFSVGADDNGNNATPTANTGGGYALEDHQDDSGSHERIYTEDFAQITAASTTAYFTIGVASHWATTVGVFAPPSPTAKTQTIVNGGARLIVNGGAQVIIQ